MNTTTTVCCLAVIGVAMTGPVAAQPAPQRTPADAAAGAAAPPRGAVDRIGVVGNTLLSDAELAAVLAPFTGSLTLAQMQQAAAAVQSAYLRAGYGGVVVYLPEQSLGDGRLTIAVVEGRIARVVVIGNRRFDDANVLRSLPGLRPGVTPRVRRIDSQIQLANENPAKRVSVTLEEGAARGDIDARVTVDESPALAAVVVADNTGDDVTGRARLGLAVQHAALWGRDHQLSARLQVSPEEPGAVRVFNVGYRVPLYDQGLMLLAYASKSNVDVGVTPTAAGDLQFSGKGRVAGLRVTRLFRRLGEFDQRASVAVDRRDYLNNCAIQGLPPGACGPSGESVTVHPLTLEYALQRQGARPAGLTVEYSTNLALGGRRGARSDFDAVRPGAERGYGIWRGSGYVVRSLGGGWQAHARAVAQASRHRLVPGEQFGPAGAGAVRGYEEREVTGDQGAVASVDWLTPVLFAPAPGAARSGPAFGGLRLLAFVDAGFARNDGDLRCDGRDTRCDVAAIGLGARFAVGPSAWKVDVARAMTDGRLTRQGDFKLHVTVSIPVF